MAVHQVYLAVIVRQEDTVQVQHLKKCSEKNAEIGLGLTYQKPLKAALGKKSLVTPDN